jgi:hypothetical protein
LKNSLKGTILFSSLLNDDSSNLILSIVNDTNVNNATSLFHLKKFLPKFYMLRLSQNASDFSFANKHKSNSSTIIKLAIEFESSVINNNNHQNVMSNNNRSRRRTLLE